MKNYSVQLLLILSVCFALITMGIKMPDNSQYNGLDDYLKKYEILKSNGGWPKIKTTRALKIGMCYPEIKSLKKRLLITGELTNTIEQPTDTFDIILEKSVITFQINHGLKPTGIVDKKTLDQLNIGVDYRIHQININMKRWKDGKIYLTNLTIIIF